MNAKTAESTLRENGGTCYLLRYSENRQMYILSVMTKAQGGTMAPHHFEIKITKKDTQNSYEIGGSEKKFISISKLLEFYESEPLSQVVESIGHRCVNSAVAGRRRYAEEKMKEDIPRKKRSGAGDHQPLQSVSSTIVLPQKASFIRSRAGGKSLDDLSLMSTHMQMRSIGSSKILDDVS